MKYEYPGKEIRRRKFLIVAVICKIIGLNKSNESNIRDISERIMRFITRNLLKGLIK